MQKINIFCNECEKFLIEAEPDVHIGAQVQRANFIFKNPALFTGVSKNLYFCAEKCQKDYYEKHIPRNPAISKAISALKEDIPKMAEETARAVQSFKERLLKLKK